MGSSEVFPGFADIYSHGYNRVVQTPESGPAQEEGNHGTLALCAMSEGTLSWDCLKIGRKAQAGDATRRGDSVNTKMSHVVRQVSRTENWWEDSQKAQ